MYLYKRIVVLIRALESIAEAHDQANPIHLRQIAKEALDKAREISNE